MRAFSAAARRSHTSEELQVPARLPVGNVPRVFGPLHALEHDEFLRQLGTESRLDDVILFELADRLEQVLRQQLDPALRELLLAELIHVEIRRLARIELAVDAI